MIAAVVAVDENWGIGRNNELLVHIPEDLKNFKKLTTGGIVVMGRKTYDSLPKKPLPNRTNIVITSNLETGKMIRQEEVNGETVFYAKLDLLKFALPFYVEDSKDDIFIIGGGMIYKELLPFCDKIYMTKIHHAYNNVDTYFPNIDKMPEWKLEMSSDIRKHNDIEYQFCIYKKQKEDNT